MKRDFIYNFIFCLTLFVVTLVFFACSSDDKGGDSNSNSSCTSDAQCEGDEMCIYGRCVDPNKGSAGTDDSDTDAGRDDDGNGTSGDSSSNGGSGRSGSTRTTATPGVAAAANVTTAFSDEICAEGTATASRLHPQVILLLDGSSSMTQEYGDMTKWAAMRQALVDPDDGVVKTMESLIEFALVVYAGEYRNGGGECPVPGDVIPHALNNYDAIDSALPAESPGRRTPTGAALDAVCRALPGISDEGTRPQYVVLATDGQPNSCEGAFNMNQPDYQSVIDAANRCCDNGVTLYVVSLASATGEFQAHLQEVADIGMCNQDDSATVYSPQSPQQLSDDLGELIGGALNCDVMLNGDVAKGKECEGSEVRLGDQLLECNDEDGWILVEPNLIRLQGDACETFKNDPNAQVTAEFPCEIFIPGDDHEDDGSGGGGGSGNGGDGGDGGGGSGGSGTGSGDPGTIIVI